ncbi:MULTISPECIES: hypothetical protein [Corynebacterium]|jgi:HTTM domain protein|uniref:HTTM-like domain-containing protein n=1 Tax=Corynebacterium pseudodiphtheriticum TaxID=37637 RepID=A0ABT7FU47_9CORY|nr:MULTISPECIES: hypothetical protein [Corynebacterium]MCG7252759.1 hypothetical protein [Corynebacterium pseudodiphtheriticum]MDK4281743.1 hypothetical protein [Corynebacterium propinquum]MDK4289508.1 hypothetical protein [Corynebacterium pseudodiphtheriticum]MDK4339783.1 hypothetical protein [Corynebacterium pseudodiphtheriticum]
MSIVQASNTVSTQWNLSWLLANPTVSHRMLGIATGLVLLANPTDMFFLPDATGPNPTCGAVAQWTLFCLLDSNLELARWILFAFCMPLVLGIAMPIAGILHLYAALSVSLSTLGVEGGDQLCVNVGILLTIYQILISVGKWIKSNKLDEIISQFNLVVLASITLQLAFVYFEAGIGKLSQQQWKEGTALWYWFQNSAYAGPSVISDFALMLLSFPLLSGLITWGTIGFQLSLSVTILTIRNFYVRKAFLTVGILFHIAIWIIFALPSFGLVMTACLLLVLGGENFLCRLGDRWIEIAGLSGRNKTNNEEKGMR